MKTFRTVPHTARADADLHEGASFRRVAGEDPHFGVGETTDDDELADQWREGLGWKTFRPNL